MPHIFGRLFFGLDVGGIRTSLQDDAKDGYIINGHGILNFGMDFLQIEFCVCQDFGCKSADNTTNTGIVGWCGGILSWLVCQVKSCIAWIRIPLLLRRALRTLGIAVCRRYDSIGEVPVSLRLWNHRIVERHEVKKSSCRAGDQE